MEVPHFDMEVPHFDISLPYKTLEKQDLGELLKLIRPDWCLDDVIIEDLSTRGFVNMNVICRFGENRLFLRVSNKTMQDHFSEQMCLKRMFVSKIGLSAPLLCTFANGFAEEFIKGEAIVWTNKQRVNDPEINKAVAEEMAKFHSKPILTQAYESKIEEGYRQLNSQWLEFLWKDIRSCALVEEEVINQLPGPDYILREAADRRKVIESLGCEKALCHGDVNPANVMVREDGRAIFVDFETLAIDYPVGDVAWFFLLSNHEPGLNPNDRYPDAEFRRQFYRNYLTAKRHYNNLSDTGDITEKELKDFDVLVSHGKLLALLVYMSYVYMLYAKKHLKVEMPVSQITEILEVMWKTYHTEKSKIEKDC